MNLSHIMAGLILGTAAAVSLMFATVFFWRAGKAMRVIAVVLWILFVLQFGFSLPVLWYTLFAGMLGFSGRLAASGACVVMLIGFISASALSSRMKAREKSIPTGPPNEKKGHEGISLAKMLALLCINIPCYASLYLFHQGGNNEAAAWIWLLVMGPASVCWLIGLGVCVMEHMAYVKRVRAGSTETIFPQIAVWFIMLPFVWILMNVAALGR